MAFRLKSVPTLVALLTLSVGCTSSPDALRYETADNVAGNVEASLLEAPSSEQYDAKRGESFLGPHRAPDSAMPAYPLSSLTSRLAPVEVKVRIVVSAEGVVTSTSSLGEPGEHPKEFLDAVVSAVSTWRFYPLLKIDASGKSTKLPFHQDYAFTFKQVDGKGVVSASSEQS